MKKLFFFIIIFKSSLLFSQNFNDTLFTTGGDTIKCKISSINKNNIRFILNTKNKFYHASFSRVYLRKITVNKDNIPYVVIKGNIDTLINLQGYENLALTKEIIAEQTKTAWIHDSIKSIIFPPSILNYKISSLIVSGEIPLIVEYRPNKIIGHEISVGYVYLNPIIGGFLKFDNILGNGYKIKYGFRIYTSINKKKTNWFYINPCIFYKQIWTNNMDHVDWKYGPGSDSRLEYHYNENKQIIGGQLLFGFAFTKRHRTFELYFGAGYRNINSYKKYTSFKSFHGYWSNFNQYDLPNTSSDNYDTPSFHLGCNWSFPIIKQKNDKY